MVRKVDKKTSAREETGSESGGAGGAVAGKEASGKIRLEQWGPAVLCALLCGGSACYELWEQDIWWQLRAGEEIWNTWKLQTVDSWTWTVKGQPWKNYCWLSCLVLHSLEKVVHYLSRHLVSGLNLVMGLVVMRQLFAGLYALAVSLGARAVTSGGSVVQIFVSLAVFVATIPRVQLRPELFVLIVIAVGIRGVVKTKDGPWEAFLVLAPLMILCGSIHYGMNPFVGLIFGALLLGTIPDLTVSSLGYLFLLALLSCAHPFPDDMFAFIIHHLPGVYFKDKVLTNPEHVPLTWDSFQDGYGNCLWVWLGLSVLATFFWLLLGDDQRPVGYKNPVVFFACHTMLILATYDRTRAAPFSALYSYPVVAAGLQQLVTDLDVKEEVVKEGSKRKEDVKRKKQGKSWKSSLLLVLLTFSSVALGMCTKAGGPRGYGISPTTLWPVGACNFVNSLPQRMKPQGNLYNTFTAGNYLVYHIRDHPVWGDTRETPFVNLTRDYKYANQDFNGMRHVTKKYNLKWMIMKIPPPQGNEPDGTFFDVIRKWQPPKDWAVVYFDDVSFICVRRTRAHKALIDAHEYEIMTPALLHDTYFSNGKNMGMVDPESVDKYEAEVARCLALSPDCVHCQLAAIAQQRLDGEMSEPVPALVDKLQVMLQQRQYPRVQWLIQHELKLLQACQRLGHFNDCPVTRMFDGGTTIPKDMKITWVD
eukprot:Hpha_TRINITY_DN15624_c2_g2::TRINITY_DN15624_c2_g2_i1::g.99210::m.99210